MSDLSASAAPEVVIDVEGLSKSFGGRKVVRNVSMLEAISN